MSFHPSVCLSVCDLVVSGPKSKYFLKYDTGDLQQKLMCNSSFNSHLSIIKLGLCKLVNEYFFHVPHKKFCRNLLKFDKGDFHKMSSSYSDFQPYCSIIKHSLNTAINGIVHLFHKPKYFVEIWYGRFSLICISIFPF